MIPSNTATVRGTIHHLGPVETVGAKGFRKQLLVLDATREGSKYNDYVVTTATRNAIEWIDEESIRIGDAVELEVRLKGREWQGRWFADVEVIGGDRIGQPVQDPEPLPEPVPPRQTSLPTTVADLEDDDVPFD